ncbi:MAG: type 2 lantipeptide synthetase LanM family protein [Polyangiaceae bacterium]|nr:type 2 lantipeptide synthetase LanM family protein [Polyangiaceae bacterium]
MSTSNVDVSDWHRATALNERIALRRRRTDAENNPAADSDRARRWRSQSPFSDASLFAERLKSDGLEESEWKRIVTESENTVRDRAGAPPAFVASITEAYTSPEIVDVSDLIPTAESLNRRVRGAVGLIPTIIPLLKAARARLAAGLAKLVSRAAAVPFDVSVVERFWLLDLPVDLLQMIDRTLVLEMHVARLQGLLAGDTPEERFQSFLARVNNPDGMIALFREYPVLARSLWTCVEQCVAAGLEFFERFVADWETVRPLFFGATDPGKLVFLEPGMGDPHRGGRSVALLRFANGMRLVYKPKSLAVDVHFQELLAWLNDRGLTPALRPIRVLDRGTYGFIEFVEGKTCNSPEEVQRFYRRQGVLVLLAYVLGATDFHYENVIAAGEHPVLIDLETLLQPYPVKRTDLTTTSLHRMVLRSGLLPHWGGAGLGFAGLDISGIGTRPGQKTVVAMPTWEGAGTDELTFSRGFGELHEGNNRATLRGQHIDVLDYTHDIVSGFSDAYQLIVHLRDEMLAPGGPIERFAHDEVRLILRSTQRYAVLRYEAFHPNLLRDALDRDRSFDRLWSEVTHTPHLAKLIPSERADLWQGDIPMFFTTPSQTTIRNSRGDAIEGVIEETSLTQVIRGIRALSETDRMRQVWFLRAALATIETRTRGRRHERKIPTDSPAKVNRSDFMDAAVAIGKRLESVAIAEDELIYLGLSRRENRWVLAPVDTSLYQGTLGIALFLGYLGAVAGEPRATTLAHATVQQALENVRRGAGPTTTIGAFEGWGSYVYTLAHLGSVWGDRELLTEAAGIAQRIGELLTQDKTFDIIGGSAGAIAALLALYNVAPSETLQKTLIACGDHLLTHAESRGEALVWPCAEEVLAPLTGFAHGTAGIGWALSRLARFTGENRFAKAAQRAFAYERAAFIPGQGWPDWRKIEGLSLETPGFEAAWCHGAPGIGLGRLLEVEPPRLVSSPLHSSSNGLNPLSNPEAQTAAHTEIETALAVTMRQQYAPDHSLCHGDLGDIELFTEAARVLGQPQWQAEADRRAARLLHSIQDEGPICGLPLDAEVPGLMIGIAGIGYGLLRLAAPEQVPSVLLLAPPK